MAIIATGNYTIVDYNDAPMLYGWINVTGSKTQGYTPDSDSYIPDFTKTPLQLTACLFVSGTSEDLLDHPDGIISSMKWSVTNSKGVTNVIPGATQRTYLVDKNLTDDTGKNYTFNCVYTQPSSMLSLPVSVSVEINKVVNGTGIADAVIIAPNGNVFKNDNFAHLPAECQLWCGSSVNTEVTASNFKWWKMDPSGTGGGHGVGNGWKSIVSGTSGYTITFTSNKSIISIPKSDVMSSETYMCTVQDSCDEKIYKETISFLDTTDPILVSFDSPGGDVFKNGVGQTVLTAMLFQNGQQVDSAGTKYTYKWFKYNKNGDLVDKNGDVVSDASIPYASGHQLQVTHEDVQEKATFRCDIS